ncbi:hypothetical protein G6Z18_13065 [Clostridium perfringens]|uniref:hypothetical protein n=1 Tax=Clostridium perfringens TaxID=1502 RepID=UPI0013E2E88D|nr:hypothetical protein [Clostridium perfringens]NGT64862.1 hypothetical protein [Clostridium perfringens]
MNRKEIIGQLEDLLYNFKNFESIETTDDDVVALEFAINELKGTAREASVQEQLINLIEGMPLYKWEQLKSCIDREFKSQANKTAFKKSNTFKKTLDLEFTH